MVNQDLFLDILYQIYLLDKLLDKEKDVLKLAKYEGMKESLLYILSLLEL